MDSAGFNSLKEKLDETYSWPSLYMFKFIVPKGQESLVQDLFPKNDVSIRPSRNGKYVSLTIEMMVGTTDQVIRIYQKASEIEGLIAL